MAATGLDMNIEVAGDRVAAERITMVGERATDIRPVKPLLDPLFHRDEQARFAVNGPGWKQLNESTIRVKQQHGWDPRILRRTGELERSLTSSGDELELSAMSGTTELAFGTTVPYARFHQYGEGVPRRELIDLSPATVNEMTATVQEYVVDGIEVLSSVSDPVGELNPDPLSIFGRIVSGSDVEDWCIALMKRWSSTYLSEVERQHGFPPLHYARPRSFVRTISFDQWPEDQLPRLIMASAGQATPPKKDADGRYRCWWVMGFGCVCSARYQEEAHEMALDYVAAIRTLFLQRPALDGHAQGIVWLDERYDDLVYDDLRSLSSGQAHFTVEVHDVAFAQAGPLAPDPPSDDPWAHWPIVLTHEETVINYGTNELGEEN